MWQIIYKRLVYYHYLLGYVLFPAFFIQERSNDLLDQENIELMPIPSMSQENSNAVTILISSEDIGDDDGDDDDDDADDDVDDDVVVVDVVRQFYSRSNSVRILQADSH